MSLFRERKDLVIKVWNAGDDDEPFICAVNGECTVDVLAAIEESLTGDDHEFSSGPGEYVYAASYDDGQYDLETGRCEISPYWELTEVGFEKPDWMSMTHEPETFEVLDEPCPNCGIVNCHNDRLHGCIPF